MWGRVQKPTAFNWLLLFSDLSLSPSLSLSGASDTNGRIASRLRRTLQCHSNVTKCQFMKSIYLHVCIGRISNYLQVNCNIVLAAKAFRDMEENCHTYSHSYLVRNRVRIRDVWGFKYRPRGWLHCGGISRDFEIVHTTKVNKVILCAKLETIRIQKFKIVDAVDDDGVFCIPRNTQREREREREGGEEESWNHIKSFLLRKNFQ